MQHKRERKEVYALETHRRKKHPPPFERSFTREERQPVGQGLKCPVCIVPRYTFTGLAEPGKRESLSSTEARKKIGNFGRSHCNYQKTQEVPLKAPGKLLLCSLAWTHRTVTTKPSDCPGSSAHNPFHFLSVFVSYQRMQLYFFSFFLFNPKGSCILSSNSLELSEGGGFSSLLGGRGERTSVFLAGDRCVGEAARSLGGTVELNTFGV